MPTGPALSEPRQLEVGRTLGRCLLTARIGQGSSAIVFRTLYQMLNSHPAIKVLHMDEEDEDVRPWLRSEARRMAQINSPVEVLLKHAKEQPVPPHESVPGLAPAYHDAVADAARTAGAGYVGLADGTTPPDRAIEYSAAGYLYGRPDSVEALASLAQAHAAYLAAWTRWPSRPSRPRRHAGWPRSPPTSTSI